MANNVRFLDQVSVSAFGNTGGGGSSISSSYAETASFAHFATSASYSVSSSHSSFAISASYAVSASHEIIKEVSSSHADTASFAQSGNGIFSGSFSGSYVGDGSGLTGVEPFPYTGSALITGSLTLIGPALFTSVVPESHVTIDSTTGTELYFSGSSNANITSDGPVYFKTLSSLGYFFGVNNTDERVLIGNQNNATANTRLVIDSLGRGISSSLATSTASFGTYLGDGSQLTGIDHDSGSWDGQFTGSASITGSLLVSGSSLPLEIIGSGSTVFSVVGSLGELFAIDDVLSGSLLVVNDISGLPQFEVLSDGRTLIGSDPRSLYTTATINATLAATSESIYSLSTSSYDGVFFDYTVNSASNARAGNIMSVWNGGNLVYTENTTTDIGSTVGVIFNVEISQSQAQLISVTDTAGWKIKTTIRSI